MIKLRAHSLKIRLAQKRDIMTIWKWRNDPLARRNSVNQKLVTLLNHREWFSNLLISNKTTLFIGIDKFSHKEIGMVRFDQSEKNLAEASINLNPLFRGNSLGWNLLSLGVYKYISTNPKTRLFAKVKKNNRRSVKTFLKAGFRQKNSQCNQLIFSL